MSVASLLHVKFACAGTIFFNAIVTKYNGPLAAKVGRIDVSKHIKLASYEASLMPKLASTGQL